MTKKDRNPLEDPPTASSSEEDEVQTSESEEEEEDSSSEENPSAVDKNAASGKPTVVSAAKQVSDSESESDGSETETDSDSEAKNPQKSGSGKTISVVALPAGKPNKEKTTVASALPVTKSGTKRPASDGSSSKDGKRAKVLTSGQEESKKKPAFQRLWSEDDEISLLQGMIDYKADTGKSPYEDTNAFYDLVKKSISFEVSRNQFTDKIRSLKKKFTGNKGKNGAEPSFTKHHDLRIYKLSKYIWGPEGIAPESNIKSNGVSKKSQSRKKNKLDSVKQKLVSAAAPNGKKVEDDDDNVSIHDEDLTTSDWFENSFLVSSIVGFAVDKHYLKRNWSLVPDEEKRKIEVMLKKLQAMEIEYVVAKSNFEHEVTSMIANASKN